MKKFSCYILWLCLVMSSVLATTVKSSPNNASANRFMVGISLEEDTWLISPLEFLPRLGAEFLVPCGERLSVGAFVGTSIFGWDAGAISAWRFNNNSRCLLGLGWSETYLTPLFRLGYKTPSGFYLAGNVCPSFKDHDCCLGLGVGYFFGGGRKK